MPNFSAFFMLSWILLLEFREMISHVKYCFDHYDYQQQQKYDQFGQYIYVLACSFFIAWWTCITVDIVTNQNNDRLCQRISTKTP